MPLPIRHAEARGILSATCGFIAQAGFTHSLSPALLLAARDRKAGPQEYLGDLAERHSSCQLNIGAELYDFWLDSLLIAVKECDPMISPEVQDALEKVMMQGASYLLSRY